MTTNMLTNRLITTLITLVLTTLSFTSLSADLFKQSAQVSHQDILRGTNTKQRAWWDLKHYHLSINVDPSNKSIRGTNVMTYQVLSKQDALQIELQPPMVLEKVEQKGQELTVKQDGYSYFIQLEKPQVIGKEYQVTLFFSGQPKEAVNPPWDGGIAWKKDENGLDFIASACQGIGASIWWPNKDQAFDEPDNGVLLSVEVPQHLTNVSNGRLVKVETHTDRQTKTFHWQVVNPINNYGVNINIGDYVHFGEKYQGEKGELDMDYYVLRDNLTKAKKQFKDATRTLEALEHWFGPYPFYEDSFKLVEAPYLGMEHQSSVTYGNQYKNGYLGRDRSSTGWGLTFDFIIVHESGHEWFANNITNEDVADMWIHEGFTSYSEALFVEYFYGKDAGAQYVRGTRLGIQNDTPLIGTYGANREGSSDMYNKGSNMLHTIRQIIDNDDKWRQIIRGLNREFYHQTVTSQQVELYITRESGKDLAKVFDQYLRDTRIPVLEYFVLDKVMKVRWGNVISDFTMPIKVQINGKTQWLSPSTKWTDVSISQKDVSVVVDADFYVGTMNILGE